MTARSDLMYGRQGGRLVEGNHRASEALQAIDRARQTSSQWPTFTDGGIAWSDGEWRSCAQFARIHQTLGTPLSAREEEALRRHPDAQPAGGYFADHVNKDQTTCPLPAPTRGEPNPPLTLLDGGPTSTPPPGERSKAARHAHPAQGTQPSLRLVP